LKKLFYLLYALFFNLSRIFPVKSNRVAFVAPHNGGEKDSLSVMRSFINQKGGYDIVFISTNDLKLNFSGLKPLVKSCLKAAGFFTLKAKTLATSKYVFLNDNFMPMAHLNFSKKTVVTQLWHAEGAFKKFGLSAPLSNEVREREKQCSSKYNYIICSSKNVVPVYAEAFGVDKSRILPLGSPRIDTLLAKKDVGAIRCEFDRLHPEAKGKSLVLYAPTFRDDPEKDGSLLKRINADLFNKEFGGEKMLLTKLHPQIHSCNPVEGTIDVTTGHDIGDLTLICDTVITDYSSVCMDFALLLKPCIFYAFDLDEYKNERSFYFDYESYVPGKIVKTPEELIEAIKNPQNGEEKLRRFRKFNFDYIDCGNAERIYNAVISSNS